jgi:hypothetical protein
MQANVNKIIKAVALATALGAFLCACGINTPIK